MGKKTELSYVDLPMWTDEGWELVREAVASIAKEQFDKDGVVGEKTEAELDGDIKLRRHDLKVWSEEDKPIREALASLAPEQFDVEEKKSLWGRIKKWFKRRKKQKENAKLLPKATASYKGGSRE